MSENIVKATAKRLGMTYRELGEAIGLSEAHIKRLATSDEVGWQVIRSLEMMVRIQELEEKNKEVEEFKKLLKKLTE